MTRLLGFGFPSQASEFADGTAFFLPVSGTMPHPAWIVLGPDLKRSETF
jgi:hypothetical protein